MKEYAFTYFSNNIEEHASPNNTCYCHNEETFNHNLHPSLKAIPKFAILPEDENIIKDLIYMGYLQENENTYTAIYNAGFPRLLINIKDKELKELMNKKHPELDEYKSTLPRSIRRYMDTLNDIKVADIQPETDEGKTAFQRILGDDYELEPQLMMYGKSKQTLFAAAKRQIKTAPTPDPQIQKQFIQYATQKIDEEIGEYLNDFNYDAAQWYNHLSLAKQKAIDPIMMYYTDPTQFYLTYTPLEIENILSWHYEAIVKAEIQRLDGKPRMVCSIPQRIKYIMGPVTWQLEEICCKHLKGYCGNKNLTQMEDEINELIDQGFTKVVEGDGSAFDNSQDVTLKALDRYIYNRIVKNIYHCNQDDFRMTANLHYKTMDVKYRRKYGPPVTYLTYKVLGTVFSGDCDTTLANTIRMAMYNRFANEASGLKYGEDFVVFSKGDDFSVLYREHVSDEFIRSIYSKYFLPKPTDEYKILDDRQGGLGQICKFLDIGGPDSFKFCSLRAWYKSFDHITLTRDPAKLPLEGTHAIKTKGKSVVELIQYHIDLAESYIANYPGIHVFDIMARAHINQAIILHNKHKNDYNYKKRTQKKINYKLSKAEELIKKIDSKQHIECIDLGYTMKINLRLYQYMNTSGREEYINMIHQSYWENVQRIERARVQTNTKEELAWINSQIDAEFDIEELKSIVGLNKCKLNQLRTTLENLNDLKELLKEYARH